MVAAVATEEPQMAPNAALAITAAMARPPRSRPTMAAVNSKSDLLMPPRVANWPMRMNSGITDRS